MSSTDSGDDAPDHGDETEPSQGARFAAPTSSQFAHTGDPQWVVEQLSESEAAVPADTVVRASSDKNSSPEKNSGSRENGAAAESSSPATEAAGEPNRSSTRTVRLADWSGPAAPTRRGRSGARVGLLVGAVAAVTVIALAIGYAALALSGRGPAGAPVAASQSSQSATSSSSPSAPPALSPDNLLDQGQAHWVDGNAQWSVASTRSGIDDSTPVATCLEKPTAEQTAPEQTEVRTLAGSGTKTTSVLHQADLFTGNEAAARVFSERAKMLGGCATETAYLTGSTSIDALGNQAISVSVALDDNGKPEYHTVLLIRTGRVLNVVDVAGTAPLDPRHPANAMSLVVNEQCVTSGGLCAEKPYGTQVVPPIGGDVPGLPVVADIPRLKSQTGFWSAADPTRDLNDVEDGSNCTRIDDVSVDPSAVLMRTYLVQDDDRIPQTYGFDVAVFTLADAAAAKRMATEVGESVAGCEDRQRTASLQKTSQIRGTGVNKAAISGTTWVIRQQTGANAANDYLDFRITVSTVGNKVVYQLLPLEKRIDFTDAQWGALSLRAAQRATQVS